ncbi:MAG: hypothetical protein EAX96_07925 [Candidatus Lokiarchaeota archaeon]|nr:hypothetical protein [Candidatus Lokiarchaeota archaeon]
MGGYGSDYSYSIDDDIVKKSAKSYNIDAGRSYRESRSSIPPPKGKHLITEAKFPIIVVVDVTGSMREFPGIIFEKLCILYNETLFFLPNELKESLEICFAAVGDAYSDYAPLQITDFAEDAELDENINSIFCEGGGGGQRRETYELAAYYFLNHCDMPNALKIPKPLLIFVGDEGFYSKINRQHIKDLIGDEKKTDLIAKNVFAKLIQKFNTYILRLSYGEPGNDVDKQIHKNWEAVLGEKKVILMKEPRRIVDTILGLIAAEVDQFEKFKERIEIRQTPDQVKQVFGALDGLETENKKKYVYEFQALTCPKCGAPLVKIPEFNKPQKCSSCDIVLVRI